MTVYYDGTFSGEGSLIARYRNIGLIYNPLAGALKRRGRKRLEAALAALRAAGHRVAPHPTDGPSTAGGIAADLIARGADLILVAGGDGTINEALNGMAGAATPLGVLPAGTANMLGHELGLGRTMEAAAGQLAGFEPLRVSLGLLRPDQAPARHFLMVAGVGLDARVVAELDGGLKHRTGKLAYWLTSFGLIGERLAEFDVEAGGVRRRCGFALAARVRNYGGDLKIARGASLLRRDFEAVLMEGASAAHYLKYFVGVVTGTLARMKGAAIVPARSLRLEPAAGERVPVQVDGELAGHLPAAIEIVDDALTLLVPPKYLAGERRCFPIQ
jgi:diacylglycerol kinase family enzyme